MGSQRLKAEGEGNSRGWDGWMASLTRWTWVWTSSSSWWWTGKPSELQFMGSQSWKRLRDWTELKELDTAERLTLHFKQCTDPYVMCFHRMKYNLGFLGSDDSWWSKCKMKFVSMLSKAYCSGDCGEREGTCPEHKEHIGSI